MRFLDWFHDYARKGGWRMERYDALKVSAWKTQDKIGCLPSSVLIWCSNCLLFRWSSSIWFSASASFFLRFSILPSACSSSYMYTKARKVWQVYLWDVETEPGQWSRLYVVTNSQSWNIKHGDVAFTVRNDRLRMSGKASFAKSYYARAAKIKQTKSSSKSLLLFHIITASQCLHHMLGQMAGKWL